MLIRKVAFEKLLKQIQNQEQEIENLNEKLDILAEFLDYQFQVNVGEGWSMLSAIPPQLIKFIDTKRRRLALRSTPVTDFSSRTLELLVKSYQSGR